MSGYYCLKYKLHTAHSTDLCRKFMLSSARRKLNFYFYSKAMEKEKSLL